ncbi:hypothetical protein [Corallococcus exercitus]|uniref:hypothetical protein n=1 Tax=Corallococcus exercitus TaxID=2316736 RepID=UPI0035D47A67
MPFKLDAVIDFPEHNSINPIKVPPCRTTPGGALTLLVLAPSEAGQPRLTLEKPVRVISQTATEYDRGVTAWYFVFYVAHAHAPSGSQKKSHRYNYSFTSDQPQPWNDTKTANGTIDVSAGGEEPPA